MDKVMEKFTKQRVKEVGDHQPLSPHGFDHLEPALREIIKGNVRGYVVGVETLEGALFVSKHQPSRELLKEINEK